MENTWREELAWCAGFFDGEGWIGIYRPKRKLVKYPDGGLPHLQLTISQADRTVLDRFRAAVRVGKVFGPYGPYVRGKSIRFMYRAEWLAAQAAAAMLWAFLSPVKREQTITALRANHDAHRQERRKLPRYRSHCGAGHALTQENVLIKQSEGYTMRVCRECQRLRIKKWREAHRDYWKERQKRKLAAALLES